MLGVMTWLLPLLIACAPTGSSRGRGGEADAPTVSTATTPSTTPPGTTPTEACTVEHFAPQQLRLLSRAEYDRSVRDLFPALRMGVCAVDADCAITAESCLAERCTPDPCGLRTFVLEADDGPYGSVLLSGTFNGWTSTDLSWAMLWEPSLGAHVGKFALEDGVHDYVFVVDGVQQADPSNPLVGDGPVASRLELDCADAPTPTVDDSLTDDLPGDGRPSGFPFDNHVEARLVTALHVELYLDTAAAIARDVVFDLDAHVVCGPGPVCAASWVDDLGRRAFRRPLTDAERTRYVDALLAEPVWADGVSVVVQALLSSPGFLYRHEVGIPQADGTTRLDGWEVATLLAYTLWGRPPDAALLAAAEAGELDDDAAVLAWAERMLDDPRGTDARIDWVIDWFGVGAVESVVKSDVVYAEFDAATRRSALDGTRARVRELVERGLPLEELFTSTEAWVDANTASLYGVPAPDSLAPVELPAGQTGGILRDVAVAATYAHSDQSSPIHRGLLVRQRLLCQELGDPPPAAGDAPEVEVGVTTRDRFAAHTADPACAGCHVLIDDPGFAFEHLDAVGGWRDTEFGQPIDASGTVLAIEGLGSGVDVAVDGLPDLAAALADADS
ncbi:MAG: hypothetical protein ACI8PZ_003945, partial [Myxococcota bacterium]